MRPALIFFWIKFRVFTVSAVAFAWVSPDQINPQDRLFCAAGAPTNPIRTIVDKFIEFNYCEQTERFAGQILYLWHDFKNLAILKYEKAVEFNRLVMAFFVGKEVICNLHN